MKRQGIGIGIAFIALCAGIGLAGIFTKDRDFSENENRYLASVPKFSWPDFWSGEFQDKLETYLNDQIWQRDGWITVKTAVEKLCGDTDIGGAYVGRDGYDFEKILPEDVDDALVERNIAAVADYLEYCSATIDEKSLSFMLVPTSGLVLEEKLPDHAILFDQRAYIGRIAEAMSGYSFISPEEVLREHAQEGVYYHTDHHWTTRGAFFAYQDWCGKTGHTVRSEDDYEVKQVSDSFRGSLYSKILDYDSVYDSIETMQRIPTVEELASAQMDGYSITADGKELEGIYQEEYLDKKDKYAYFFGGNYGEVRIGHTEKKGKGNLLIIKDSFANAFVPFLMEDYDNLYMIDLRYYSGDMTSYIEENQITDVLVLYNVANFISDKNIYKLSRGL